MAQTQSIKCISCGKTLGVVDISTGDFKTITFNTKWDKVDKIAAKDEKDQKEERSAWKNSTQFKNARS